jgi:hypothetical protein
MPTSFQRRRLPGRLSTAGVNEPSPNQYFRANIRIKILPAERMRNNTRSTSLLILAWDIEEPASVYNDRIFVPV